MAEFQSQVHLKRNLLHSLTAPLTALAAKRDHLVCVEMANEAWGLDLNSPASVESHANELHAQLNALMPDDQNTFFEALTAFDLVVYAYLKEEIVNTSESEMVKYLQENCSKLVKFVSHMDNMPERNESGSQIEFKQRDECSLARIYNSLLQRETTGIFSVLELVSQRVPLRQVE